MSDSIWLATNLDENGVIDLLDERIAAPIMPPHLTQAGKATSDCGEAV